MKKGLSLCLILIGLISFVFAEDAKVMPMMVGRVYVAPTFSFAPGAYDEDGDYDSFDEPVKLFNLGLVLEYGVIDWISAAIQWAPGWTPWSDVKGRSGYADSNTNGVADLFVGAKIQIVGEKAPVQNSMFRASMAPGVIIPMPGPDFEDEFPNAEAGKEATLSKMDNHVFGAGIRLYFDWIINKSFFINFHNETIFYPIAQNLNKDGPVLAGVKAGTKLKAPSSLHDAIDKIDGEVKYKYKLTFEIEPVYTKSLADGVNFSAGLPVTYKYIPAYDYALEIPSTLPDAITAGVEKEFTGRVNAEPVHTIFVKPGVSVFFTKTPMPLEFKLQYQLPVWGKNSMAQHAVTLQARVYFALPGRPE